MKKRKKKTLDGIDREIIRLLYERGALVSSTIAKTVGLSSSAIFPRLDNLAGLGIIKMGKVLSERNFNRKFGKKTRRVSSPRAIYWEVDIKD